MSEKKLYINVGFIYGRIYVTDVELKPGALSKKQVRDIKEIGYFENTIVKIEKYNCDYCEELSTSTEGIF